MSNFMANEVPNIYEDEDSNPHTQGTGNPHGECSSQGVKSQKTVSDASISSSANQNSQPEHRMLEYNSPHPATATSMQNNPADGSLIHNRDGSYPPFEKRYLEKSGNYPSQSYPWSQVSSHQPISESYPTAANQTSSYAQVSPSNSLSTVRSAPVANPQNLPVNSPVRAPPTRPISSHAPQPSQVSNTSTLQNNNRKTSSNKLAPQNHSGHVSSREPDGRRWTSRIETPQDLEVPVQFPYPQYGYQHQQTSIIGMRGPATAGRAHYNQNYTPPPRSGVILGSGQQERDIEGLGIHNYTSSPRVSQIDSSRRTSIGEVGYSDGPPGWAEENSQRATQYYQGMGPGSYPNYPQNSWAGQGYSHHPIPSHQSTVRANHVPEWPSQNPGYMGLQTRADSASIERPPGGWYWSVTTVHQHKRTESRSTQQRHRHEAGREENTVPVQLCEPPLANIVPPNPAALAGDPPPKNKKKSKYTVEQDKLILDLKHQGLGWSEIAKLAKCDKTLAARNRYQVLIGQQGGGTFLWSHSEIRKLQSYLDEAERSKWLYLADELSRRRGRKFTLAMCHYKVSEMFRENPALFGVLKSKDPRSGGKPVKREEYVSHFSTLPPDDSPSYTYQQNSAPQRPPGPSSDSV